MKNKEIRAITASRKWETKETSIEVFLEIEGEGVIQAAGEEFLAGGLVAAREEPHGDGGAGTVVTVAEDLAVGVHDADLVAGLGLAALEAGDGIREDPGMSAMEGFGAPAAQAQGGRCVRHSRSVAERRAQKREEAAKASSPDDLAADETT